GEAAESLRDDIKERTASDRARAAQAADLLDADGRLERRARRPERSTRRRAVHRCSASRRDEDPQQQTSRPAGWVTRRVAWGDRRTLFAYIHRQRFGPDG